MASTSAFGEQGDSRSKPQRASRNGWKAVLGNVSLLVVSALVSLALGEAVVRYLAPQQLIVPNPKIWRPDAELGWRHRELADTRINTGEGLVRFATDSLGYRVSDPHAHENKAETQLLALGDSYVEAVQVEDSATMTRLLGKRLTQVWARPIVVVNDGVGGWNPNHYLKEARLAMERGRFQMGLIFIYSANDILSYRQTEFSPDSVGYRHRFHWPHDFSMKSFTNAFLYPVNDVLETKSHLFVLLKSRLAVLLARLGLTAYYFPDTFLVSEADSRRWANTASICRDVADVFSHQNIPVLFVLLPAPYQVHEEEFYRYVQMFDIQEDSVSLEQPRRLLAPLFRADSLELLDPLDFLRARAREGTRLYGRVDNHFNAAGHAAMAEFLLPYVIRRLEAVLPRDRTEGFSTPSP